MTEALQQEIRTLRSLLDSERDPEGRAFAPLADAHRRAGEIPAAVQLLNEGLARHPDFASGHVVAAQLYVEQGLMEEGAIAARRALALDAENTLALGSLVRVLQHQGDAEELEELRSRLVSLDPAYAAEGTVVDTPAAPGADRGYEDVVGLESLAPEGSGAESVDPDADTRQLTSVDTGPDPAEAPAGPDLLDVPASIDLGLDLAEPPAADDPGLLDLPPPVPDVGLEDDALVLADPRVDDPGEPMADPFETPLDVSEPVGQGSGGDPTLIGFDYEPPDGPAAVDLGSLAPDEPEAVDLGALAPDEPEAVDLGALAPDEPEAVDLGALAPDEPEAVDLGALAPDEPEAVDLGALAPDEPEAVDLGALAPDEPEAVDLGSLAPDEPVVDLDTLGPTAPTEDAVDLGALAPDEPEAVDLGALAPDEPEAVDLGALAPDEPMVDLDTLGPAAPAEDAVDLAALAPDVEDDEASEDEAGDEDAGRGEPIYTRTLGELYVKQGALDQALDVFRHLLEKDPHDEEIAARIVELESGGASDEAAGSSEGDPEAASIGEYFKGLLRWEPGDGP